jgi:hypothetical protein
MARIKKSSIRLTYEDLRTFFRQHPDEPWHLRDIQPEIKWEKISTLRTAISRLYDKNFLQRLGPGVYVHHPDSGKGGESDPKRKCIELPETHFVVSASLLVAASDRDRVNEVIEKCRLLLNMHSEIGIEDIRVDSIRRATEDEFKVKTVVRFR